MKIPSRAITDARPRENGADYSDAVHGWQTGSSSTGQMGLRGADASGTCESMTERDSITTRLDGILAALNRLAPAPLPTPDFAASQAFIWSVRPRGLRPVDSVNRIDIALLKGIGRVRDLLLDNTRRFAGGFPANNALLWGARGMGKSSLVKAAHGALVAEHETLKLIEIHREDIDSLPQLLELIRDRPERFIVFCDDLSFEPGDTDFKALKAALDGGIDGRPGNTILYATSNRRHLLARDMMENERSTAVTPHEAVEEKVSLSDRFGLWLGFHACSQDDYLEMVRSYARYFGVVLDESELVADALEWSVTRGARSGRVAWQFALDLAGRYGVKQPPV